jgi:hypothetical protein
VRVVVKEWARRNGAADGTTTKFIKEVPFFIIWSASCVTLAREAYDVFRECLNDTLFVQLQSEWTNDETIPNMAQKVRDKG